MTHAKDWQTFWQQAGTSSKQDSGIHDRAIENCWREILPAELADREGPVRVVDLACGDGALSRLVFDIAGDTPVELSAVDIAPAALEVLSGALPTARPIEASAAATGLPGEGFDLVVSQFGLEYAGPGATGEALRLMAPGATLVLLQHRRDSAIDQQSAAAASYLKAIDEIGLLSAFRQLVIEARALQRKEGSLQRCESADRALGASVTTAKQLMSRTAGNPASGVIQALYRDIARMYERMGHYAPDEILAWIDSAEGELTAFAGRMSSMSDAAMDLAAFQNQLRRLEADGLHSGRSGGIDLSDGRPAAWLTVARRPG